MNDNDPIASAFERRYIHLDLKVDVQPFRPKHKITVTGW